LTKGVSPQQMAQAYTAFANGGVMSQAHYITKIVDASGKVIVSSPKAKQTQVISSKVANNMTRMMLGTYTDGTGVGSAPSGYTIAGKTGTTENPNSTNNASSSKDSWAMAYTKDIVQATWMGLEGNNTGSLPLGLTSTMGPLVKTSLEQILPNTDQTAFTVTNPNTTSSSTSQSSDLWGTIQDDFNSGVDKAVEGAGQLWNNVKGLFGN